MSLDSLRHRIGRIEREAAPPRDRVRRLIEYVALAKLRKGGRDVRGVDDLALRPESELLAIVGAESRAAFEAVIPELRDVLTREKERRSREPERA